MERTSCDTASHVKIHIQKWGIQGSSNSQTVTCQQSKLLLLLPTEPHSVECPGVAVPVYGEYKNVTCCSHPSTDSVTGDYGARLKVTL